LRGEGVDHGDHSHTRDQGDPHGHLSRQDRGLGCLSIAFNMEVADVLSINYRVGLQECGFLRLIGDTNFDSVFHTAVWGEIKDLAELDEKKTNDEAPVPLSS